MNFIDAFMIADDYIESLAHGQKVNEKWKRASALKNTKQEICDAFKLVFAHSLFWCTIPNEDLKLYEQSLGHVGDFIKDELVDEYNEISRTLNNHNLFTKLQDKYERNKLEAREKEIVSSITASMMDGMRRKQDLSGFISWLLPKMRDFKNKCAALPDNVYKAQYGDLQGNFVCDIYEKANINREYDDTEYYWPLERLIKLADDPKFDSLFAKYRVYIHQLYARYHR